MAPPVQILVREPTAARMLDMPTYQFRRLVASGSLPPPRIIAPGVERWYVPDLDAIAKGVAPEGMIEW